MIKKLLFFLCLPLAGMTQTQIGQDITGDAIGDKFGWGVALSSDGNVMAASAIKNDNNGTDSGHVRVYSKFSGTWVQVGQDIEGANPDDQIGYKIALSDDGSVLALSATYAKYVLNNTTYSGYVSIYKNINGVWTKIGQDIKANPATSMDKNLMGLSIALSSDGSTIAIGSPDYSDYLNGVEIYRNISGKWTLIGNFGSFVINDPNSDAETLGWSVSLSGDGNTIAFSSLKSHTFGVYGSVKILKYASGNWTQTDLLISSQDDLYGFRVVISEDGNTLAISAPNSDKNGPMSSRTGVYKNNGGKWTQVGQDILGTTGSRSGMGLSMSANGNVLAIGSPNADTANGTNTGKVLIFENMQGNWIEKGALLGANQDDGIGWSIALSKDGYNLAIGNYGSSNVSEKSSVNILDTQISNNNSDFQAKGAIPESVQVYNLSGILSSDKFVTKNFSIYPNPATDILNIELEDSSTLNKVLIYSANGQLIRESSDKIMNVSGLAKGMYNVQVITDQGKATKKLIIN